MKPSVSSHLFLNGALCLEKSGMKWCDRDPKIQRQNSCILKWDQTRPGYHHAPYQHQKRKPKRKRKLWFSHPLSHSTYILFSFSRREISAITTITTTIYYYYYVYAFFPTTYHPSTIRTYRIPTSRSMYVDINIHTPSLHATRLKPSSSK